MKYRFALILPLAATALSMTACSQVKDTLGLNRRSPDDFAVMTRAPLEMPPSMTTLPTPQPGMPRPQEMSPVTSAQTAILGQSATSSDLESRAETSLLQKAGAMEASPNIRAVVNKESAEGAEDNRPVAKKLLGLVNKSEDDPASVVDAPGELQRLKTNQQAGQPVTQGETPSYDD